MALRGEVGLEAAGEGGGGIGRRRLAGGERWGVGTTGEADGASRGPSRKTPRGLGRQRWRRRRGPTSAGPRRKEVGDPDATSVRGAGRTRTLWITYGVSPKNTYTHKNFPPILLTRNLYTLTHSDSK